jgi:hypothetical protein
MKLSYRIERQDHSAFQWHHFWRSSSTWRNYGVLLFLGILLVSYTLSGRGLELQTVVTYVAGYILLMIVIFTVTNYLALTSAIRRQIPPGDNNGVVGDHCFIVDDAVVCEQAGPIETRVKWHAIRKVSVGEDHAFIYYAPNQAFIVPKRAFTDESDFNRFVRDCVSRLPENTLNPRPHQP